MEMDIIVIKYYGEYCLVVLLRRVFLIKQVKY